MASRTAKANSNFGVGRVCIPGTAGGFICNYDVHICGSAKTHVLLSYAYGTAVWIPNPVYSTTSGACQFGPASVFHGRDADCDDASPNATVETGKVLTAKAMTRPSVRVNAVQVRPTAWHFPYSDQHIARRRKASPLAFAALPTNSHISTMPSMPNAYQAPAYPQASAYGSATFSPASQYSAPSSTSERYAPQVPQILYSPASAKEVRFATSPDPNSPCIYPRGHPRGSPYMPSPETPSLVYTPNHEDRNIECPATPLLSPRPLTPESQPSLFGPSASLHASRYEIDRVLSELKYFVDAYHYPTELDYEVAPMSYQSAPGIPYTATNRPFLEHIQKLQDLQSRLNAIRAHGDEGLRKSRKAASAQVQQALKELGRVEAMCRRRWESELQRRRQH